MIIITYNNYTFSTNNRIQKAWAQKSDTFFCPRSWGQKIMVFKFIFFYEQLNLAFFTLKKREKVI